MAEVLWYYARNDEPFGPVSAVELKQLADAGQLSPDDLLWREGMEAWTTAINLHGLFTDDPGGKTSVASSIASPRVGEKASPRSAGFVPPASSRRRLAALLRTTQTVLWTMCVLVVLAGVILFTRAFLAAQDANQEAAAGAVFSTFFIGAYVLARCGEKLSRLLLAHARRRR